MSLSTVLTSFNRIRHHGWTPEILINLLIAFVSEVRSLETRVERIEQLGEAFERRCLRHEACVADHDLGRACWDKQQEDKPR